jgi:hypothetical protein
MLPVGFAADAAERLEKFKQADILMTCTLQNREGIDCDGRINGDVFFVRGRRGGQKSCAG